MWPFRDIDIKITREMFEALYTWLNKKHEEVSPQLRSGEAAPDTYDLVLHDFFLHRMTEKHITMWSHHTYGKLYNYKLSPSLAMILHERLVEERFDNKWNLEKFHFQLYVVMDRYFSEEKLNPKQKKQEAFEAAMK